MSGLNWLAVAPLLVLSGGALLLMLLVSIRRGVTGAWLTALLTLLIAAISCIPAGRAIPVDVTPLLLADGYSLFFAALFSACAFVTVLVSRDYLASRPGQNEEYYLLLLLSTLGAVTLAYANHFASLLLGMELLGVSLYALIAYPDRQVLPLEAAIKYLVLSAAASAMFLFGFALLYAGTGALEYAAIGVALQTGAHAESLVVLAAAALIVAGLGFQNHGLVIRSGINEEIVNRAGRTGGTCRAPGGTRRSRRAAGRAGPRRRDLAHGLAGAVGPLGRRRGSLPAAER